MKRDARSKSLFAAVTSVIRCYELVRLIQPHKGSRRLHRYGYSKRRPYVAESKTSV